MLACEHQETFSSVPNGTVPNGTVVPNGTTAASRCGIPPRLPRVEIPVGDGSLWSDRQLYDKFLPPFPSCLYPSCLHPCACHGRGRLRWKVTMQHRNARQKLLLVSPSDVTETQGTTKQSIAMSASRRRTRRRAREGRLDCRMAASRTALRSPMQRTHGRPRGTARQADGPRCSKDGSLDDPRDVDEADAIAIPGDAAAACTALQQPMSMADLPLWKFGAGDVAVLASRMLLGRALHVRAAHKAITHRAHLHGSGGWYARSSGGRDS